MGKYARIYALATQGILTMIILAVLGYFIGMKGTSIVRKITKQEYQEYRLVYEEWEYTKGDDKIEETNSNDTNRSNIFSRMFSARCSIDHFNVFIP